MTFSIVARCPRTGQLGVGAVTATPGVGQLVTWAAPHVGAAATQGWVNPYLGIDALDLLGNGHPAKLALRAVIALDERSELRQVGVVDAHGDAAAHTGARCEDWAGHHTGQDYSVQGNLIDGPAVLDAAIDTFVECSGDHLVERLIASLEAGEHAGGDRRGATSAAVFVVATERYPLWDLRVDSANGDPLVALRRLHEQTAETLLPQILRLPGRKRPGDLSADEHVGLV